MRVIRNYDVASYYPHLMVLYGYTSRNIPSPETFANVLERRLKAKEEGDKHTSDTLKLVINTAYGASLNKYNDLYDPLMGRSVCVSGQLFLLDLAYGYLKACDTVKIIQTNTDGVLISVDDSELPKIHAVNREWEERTGFTLEEDKVRKVVQANVNNYIMVMLDGRVKTKGSYVTYGIAPAGAWKVNNDYVIVKKAIIDYFVKDKPVEETILTSDNIHEFQYIAKAGKKYSHVYHIVDGKKVPVQKVNRVYATKGKRYGTLYKVHKETGRPAKIEDLPKHCIIDNRNELNIRDIDKEHYIEKAKKMIGDFIGDGGEESMEYVRLSDLKKVPGIGAKTMERIRAECEIFTLDEEPKSFDWLDELLESEVS